ncbi:hypothetical protein IWX80_001420 [Flavobacterium sp. CAN_S2]
MAQSPPYLGELELFNGWYIQVVGNPNQTERIKKNRKLLVHV